MAKKRTKAPEEKREKEPLFAHIDDNVRHVALSLSFFVLAIFFILSPFGKAGVVGNKIHEWFTILFGLGYYIIPALFLLLGISYLKKGRPRFATATALASILFLISMLGITALVGSVFFDSERAGGIIGNLIERPMVKFFDRFISFLFLSLFALISALVITNTVPSRDTIMFWKRFKKEPAQDETLNEKEKAMVAEIENENAPQRIETPTSATIAAPTMPDMEHTEHVEPKKERTTLKDMLGLGKDPSRSFLDTVANIAPFTPPPVDLLSGDKGKPEFGDIKANVNIIKRTLSNFGISVEMDEVSVGPSITRYSLKPAEGVKLSRIVGLQNDLALALAAHPLRIEAPIPGKSLVGIEIPNTVKTTVGLGTILKESEYQESPKPLLMGIGKAINGKAYFANLAKMPHLLIAGTTGSGKSVTVHAMINSLLFRNPPENLRFIMVDPKRVELTLYNNIPHLYTPVITDPKKAIRALKWAVKEMERRYDVLETEHVRDISSYHSNIYTPALKKFQSAAKKKKDEGDTSENMPEERLPERLPYIVIIIDELADIMTTYPRELEAGIVRLAQMSRAVGIHLVLSTQRPSVNIITGLIKANIPARVALQVSSQIDSRTILDTGGAEKLLGAGDMLYLSGEMSKPIRLQSAFISENEIKKVVKHIIHAYRERLPDEIDLTSPENNTDAIFSANMDDDEDDDERGEDDMYEKAREAVVAAQKASTSYLQRRLGLGYSRAARIVDMLEERGVVGPANGSKSREVYEKPHMKEGEFPSDHQQS